MTCDYAINYTKMYDKLTTRCFFRGDPLLRSIHIIGPTVWMTVAKDVHAKEPHRASTCITVRHTQTLTVFNSQKS